MSDTQTDTANRIQVTFGVDVDVETLTRLKTQLDKTRQGTVECSIAWDALKTHRDFFLGRLDGECAAYMNIAKEQVRQLFGM